MSLPTVFIVGTTAVGKTRLSLSLSSLIPSKILNCDSMQLYKSADILTAKATAMERSIVPHCLLDILDITDISFNRLDYLPLAKQELEEGRREGKMIMIVGGTNYYMEGLMFDESRRKEGEGNEEEAKEDKEERERWKEEVEREKKKEREEEEEEEEEMGEERRGESEEGRELKKLERGKCKDKIVKTYNNKRQILQKKENIIIDDFTDYDLLKRIDPLMAEKFHRNDKRRIENALKLYQKFGIPPSQIYLSNPSHSRSLSHSNIVVLWPYFTNKEKLWARIEERINEMLDFNGIKEIIRIYHDFLKIKEKIDFTKGLFQAIGYKEFNPFYEFIKNREELNKMNWFENEELLTNLMKEEEVANIFESCKKQLIRNSIKYAKSQIKWLKNRLASFSSLQNHFFFLPFDEIQDFEEKVVEPSKKIILHFAGKENFKQIRDCLVIKSAILMGGRMEEKRKRRKAGELGREEEQRGGFCEEWKREEEINKKREILMEEEGKEAKLAEGEVKKKEEEVFEEEAEEGSRHLESGVKKREIKDGEEEKNERRETLKDWRKHFCSICKKECNGSNEWMSHLNSREHRRKRRREQREKNDFANKNKEELKDKEITIEKEDKGKDIKEGWSKEEEEKKEEEKRLGLEVIELSFFNI